MKEENRAFDETFLMKIIVLKGCKHT